MNQMNQIYNGKVKVSGSRSFNYGTLSNETVNKEKATNVGNFRRGTSSIITSLYRLRIYPTTGRGGNS